MAQYRQIPHVDLDTMINGNNEGRVLAVIWRNARWKSGTHYSKFHAPVSVDIGEYAISTRELAAETNISHKCVRTAVKKLIQKGILSMRKVGSRGISVYRLANYETQKLPQKGHRLEVEERKPVLDKFESSRQKGHRQGTGSDEKRAQASEPKPLDNKEVPETPSPKRAQASTDLGHSSMIDIKAIDRNNSMEQVACAPAPVADKNAKCSDEEQRADGGYESRIDVSDAGWDIDKESENESVRGEGSLSANDKMVLEWAGAGIEILDV